MCPSGYLNLQLTPTEFVVLLKWWLGLPLAPTETVATCPQCGEVQDCFGDHALCCKRGGMYQRHNAVVDVLCEWAAAAGISFERSVAMGGLIPADVLLGR